MSYTGKRRLALLQAAKLQLNADKEREILSDLEDIIADYVDYNADVWEAAYDYLNDRFWGGSLRSIPVRMIYEKQNRYGVYNHSGYIHLNSRYAGKLTALHYLGVLLHEMCHHWVQETYGHGVSSNNGGKRVIGHGKEWKREMRRVGYIGKITRFTGPQRFVNRTL